MGIIFFPIFYQNEQIHLPKYLELDPPGNLNTYLVILELYTLVLCVERTKCFELWKFQKFSNLDALQN